MPTVNNFYPGKSRQYIVIGIIGFLFFFLTYSLIEFLTSFLGALLFYVLFHKFMRMLVEKKHWKKWAAATLIIFISFLVIIIPTFGLMYALFGKVQTIVNNPQDVIMGYHTLIDKLNGVFGREILNNKLLTDFTKNLATEIPSLLNSTLQILGVIMMMYFLLFYLLINIGQVEKSLFSYLPFSEFGIKMLTTELRDMTYANAIAVPLIAICQGIIATIGFWIFGLNDPLFWGIICGCTSIIPVVGAGLIWVPAGTYLLTTAESWQGIGILIYGIIIISTIDNIFRFFFARWFADVHPIITILGVIIGLKWFGLPGLVFGPLVFSYFFLLLKIYRKEFIEKAELKT